MLCDEEASAGIPGFRHYRYRLTCNGDNAARVTPIGEQPKTGFSHSVAAIRPPAGSTGRRAWLAMQTN